MTTFTENRKARFDLELLECLEAGIGLLGFEVKAVKSNKMSLEGSYIFPRKGELWLVGATIAPYQPKNTPKDYDQMRERKLLLKKDEINHLIGRFSTKGLTILPVRVYNKHNKVKVEIAIAKKRRAHDKRERIKERETGRTISRTLKEI